MTSDYTWHQHIKVCNVHWLPVNLTTGLNFTVMFYASAELAHGLIRVNYCFNIILKELFSIYPRQSLKSINCILGCRNHNLYRCTFRKDSSMNLQYKHQRKLHREILHITLTTVR